MMKCGTVQKNKEKVYKQGGKIPIQFWVTGINLDCCKNISGITEYKDDYQQLCP